jgi:hypothetical protein
MEVVVPRPGHTPPEYLDGIFTKLEYNAMLRKKAGVLLQEDRTRKRPWAEGATFTVYETTIHDAICAGGQFDPFTGEKLQWELTKEYSPKKSKGDREYLRQFYLMPTVDHIDPFSQILEFQICSWKINACKNCQNPVEFLDMCRKVVEYKKRKVFSAPVQIVYHLPAFLEGICTGVHYRRWLLRKAKYILDRDRKANRACAIGATMKTYRMAIHQAVLACGLYDPFTGDALAWDRISTWVNTKTKNLTDIYKKEFSLLPTVDHVDPDGTALGFEICGLLVNTCKSNFTPDEFVAICGDVVRHCIREN